MLLGDGRGGVGGVFVSEGVWIVRDGVGNGCIHLALLAFSGLLLWFRCIILQFQSDPVLIND